MKSLTLEEHFGSPDAYNVDTHVSILLRQYFPHIDSSSPVCLRLRDTLLQARTDSERLRVEMIIKRGGNTFAQGCADLETRMRGSIASIMDVQPASGPLRIEAI